MSKIRKISKWKISQRQRAIETLKVINFGGANPFARIFYQAGAELGIPFLTISMLTNTLDSQIFRGTFTKTDVNARQKHF